MSDTERAMHTERHERWAKCLYPTYEPAKILAEKWSRDVIDRAVALADDETDECHGWKVSP